MPMSQPRCFRIHADDNVGTLLDDVTGSGDVRVLGHANQAAVAASESMKLGHKIALAPIASGEAVVKFGVAIGRASRDIAPGQWVHLHNCTSFFDERSQTLDLHSGAATDTKYE
jgi:hypothetical protein